MTIKDYILKLNLLKTYMIDLNTEQTNQKPKAFLLPFTINLMTLLSVGFIAGSVVHVGFNNSNNIYYIIFGVVGCFLFVLGNYLQEKLINKNQMGGLRAVTFLLVTLLLSISVGMVSGGLQHFLDFPAYATYLIPLGIFFSTLFYMIKNEYKPFNCYLPILIASLLLSGVVFVGARQLAETVQPVGHHGNSFLENSSNDHHAPTASTESHDMSSLVTNDKSFIENMIPHHIEAINTSKIIIQSTKDTELKAFAEKVIIDQTSEVNTMKTLYKGLAGSDYTDNSTYMAMMADMNGKMDSDLDKAYIKGMIGHHEGAISMAKKILPISISTEIKTLAKNIINSQTNEIGALNVWLTTKFTSGTSTSTVHSDGHSGH